MAIAASGVAVQQVEVVLRSKPAALLAASPKGTVPVLVLHGGGVIDESLDIMRWALDLHDPQQWQVQQDWTSHALVCHNDRVFKPSLDRYKYANRYPEAPLDAHRAHANTCLAPVLGQLAGSPWLSGVALGAVDVALFPFVRQFAQVDRPWFDATHCDLLLPWLERMLALPEFKVAMRVPA